MRVSYRGHPLGVAFVQKSQENQLVVVPGAMTPTEILTAWNAGADMVKVFPAGQLGGP